MVLYLGWTPDQAAHFTAAADHISAVVGGLGGILTLMIGVEDADYKVALPPPSTEYHPQD